MAEVLDLVLKKIEDAFPATKWIRELPQYKCVGCGQLTIFKPDCLECQEGEDYEYAISDFEW